MLERAIISDVTCTVDETVYRVDGAVPATLFTALAEARINVDTILQSDGGLVFSAPSADAEATSRVLQELDVPWDADASLGQVSIVGAGMKSHPGVAATALATLAQSGIDPVIVTTSPVRIACHVRLEAIDDAVRALHDAFGLEQAGGAA
jgi:aspartate kinase